jgi:hypothetical protein
LGKYALAIDTTAPTVSMSKSIEGEGEVQKNNSTPLMIPAQELRAMTVFEWELDFI